MAFLPSLSAAGDGVADVKPALPQRLLDTSYTVPTGRTIAVPAGGDLQAALNSAAGGDVITLEAGAVFQGPFTLPARKDGGRVVVRTSTPEGKFPSPGSRISPASAAMMPRITAPDRSSALVTAPGARGYRLVGLEIAPSAEAGKIWNLVSLGDSDSRSGPKASDIVIDRCWLHGRPDLDLRRAVALNSASSAVVDSWISDVHEIGADSQAICGWCGPGPFKIAGNYLEGAGENVMFGGADSVSATNIPSDIEVRGNYFFKPLSWRIEEKSYAGKPWTVKNSFELKQARRVLIDGNIFENCWPHAQVGFAVLFTVRTEDGTNPWAVVEDVTFSNNIVRSAAGGVNILGRDGTHGGVTRCILVRNNLFEKVGAFGGSGRLLQVIDGAENVVFANNTALHSGTILTADGAPSTGLVFRDNIMAHNEYGVHGSGKGVGLSSLEAYFPGHIFQGNVLAGGSSRLYPEGNFFPARLTEARFKDEADDDYRLAGDSPYRRQGSGGKDIGLDWDEFTAAQKPVAGSKQP